MEDRDRITSFINRCLDSENIKDRSLNGMQVEGRRAVKKIAFGVSASLELIRIAAAAGADMIIVHHGLLWDRPLRVRGPLREKMELLVKNEISLCAWHLPLDLHGRVGNNARLLDILGAKKRRPFGIYEGETIGFSGVLPAKKTAAQIAETISVALAAIPDACAGRGTRGRAGAAPRVICYNFGPKTVKTVGVVSGGAQGMFTQAIEAGLDLYITGEVSEFVQEMARENKISFIAAGHYNTEKTGVGALAKLVSSRFKVQTLFIDIPNQA